MLSFIPAGIDLGALSGEGARIEGSFSYEGLSRLQALIVRALGDIELDVTFSRRAMPGAEGHEGAPDDPRRVPVATGRVTGRVVVTCQRCLGELELELRSRIALAWTSGGGAPVPRALRGFEVLERVPGPLDLRTLVEDELLLALPDYPKHPEDVCGEVLGRYRSEGEPGTSPFAVLAALRDGASGH